MSSPSADVLRRAADWCEYFDADSPAEAAEMRDLVSWLRRRATGAEVDERIRDVLRERGVEPTRANVADVKRRMIAARHATERAVQR